MSDKQIIEEFVHNVSRYVYRIMPYTKIGHGVKNYTTEITLLMFFAGELRESKYLVNFNGIEHSLKHETYFNLVRSVASCLVRELFLFELKPVDLDKEMKKDGNEKKEG